MTITGPTFTIPGGGRSFDNCPKCSESGYTGPDVRRDCAYCANTGMTPVWVCGVCHQRFELNEEVKEYGQEFCHQACVPKPRIHEGQ